MKDVLDPRFIIAYTIIIGFAAAYVHDPSETMTGALIGAFAGAWGFYLGSSRGAASANESVGKALDLAAAATPSPVPDVILQPGETAQAKE
jgi:hypothetical protein